MRGHIDTLTRSLIIGWAGNPQHPEQELRLHVTIDGRRFTVVANIMREDLLSVFPGSTGRYGFRIEDDALRLSPFTSHDVAIAFARTGAPLMGGVAVIPAMGHDIASRKGDSRPVAGLTPVIVTSTGRSGSSLLMHRLSRHPGIAVAREHPYELKLISYYSYALRTLISKADRANSSSPETMGAVASRFFIGFNPYNDQHDENDPDLADFWNIEAPDHLGNSFAQLIELYYRRVAHTTGKPLAKFFAEKIGAVDLVREATCRMFGAVKEIVLVRDPRDVICSSSSFWQRDFEASVKSLRGQLKTMSRPRGESNLTQLVLRYEDLLLQPADAMASIWEFLSVAPHDVISDTAAEAQVFARHGTSASPEATIGRWRRDLSTEQAATALTELGPFLNKFGYGPDAPP